MRKVAVVAALALWLVAPACLANSYDFTLNNVTFDDSGTATGSFTLDLTTGLLSNVNITTSPDNDVGASFVDGPFNSFTNGASAQVEVGTGLDYLDLVVAGPLTDTNLAGSPSLALSGSESFYFILCGPFPCQTRTITGGTLDVSAATAETPLPATLPLLASGLGVLGYYSRRRRKAR